MIHYKEIERNYKDKVIESITCDICKESFPNGHWKLEHSYHVLETEVSLKQGVSYPEGGGGTQYSFDICPDCFKNVLIPWFAEIGIKPNEKDWEVG